MSGVLDSKSQVQNLIVRKKQQIKLFEEDKTRDDKDKSFSDAQYDEKIKQLQTEIEDLEEQLNL